MVFLATWHCETNYVIKIVQKYGMVNNTMPSSSILVEHLVGKAQNSLSKAKTLEPHICICKACLA